MLDELHGPLLHVSLQPEPMFAQMARQAHRPVPPQRQGWALIDTGARLTAIDVSVATDMMYRQISMAEAYTPSTGDRGTMVPVFYGSVVFPGTSLPSCEQMMLGMNLGYPVQGRPVLLLLGRDFLSDKKLVYDAPNGRVVLFW